jgi:hypothetical protein
VSAEPCAACTIALLARDSGEAAIAGLATAITRSTAERLTASFCTRHRESFRRFVLASVERTDVQASKSTSH